MNALGIYFGSQVINIVETKGKQLISNLQISRLDISRSGLEEKVPDEIKVVALLKDELRRHKINANEVTLCLSGKDLIIRTFEMPPMPRAEFSNAVNFEAKKYLPFKVEDLVSDFQIELDKSPKKNLVLFVGIKKETFDKYLSILSQLDLKVVGIEYSAFSILRLLRLGGFSNKGIIGIIGVDFQEGEEVNFTVLKNGFPLFSRDITLWGKPELFTETAKEDKAALLEKLKTEMRISLDYYHRKFLVKEIKKTFFISDPSYRSDLEALANEIGLSPQFIDTVKFFGKPIKFSLGFLKTYSGSLSQRIKTPLKINLLSIKTRMEKEAIGPRAGVAYLTAGLRIEPKIVIVGLLLCMGLFFYGKYQILPLQRELEYIINRRPRVFTATPQSSYEELISLNSKYQEKIDAIDNFIKKQLYLTKPLNVIPGIIPDGIWLTRFFFGKEENRSELTLTGIAYLADTAKELERINTFLSSLKENPVLTKYFKEIDIISVEQMQEEKTSLTNFLISCQSQKRD